MKFADFDLNPSLLQALDEMGYTAPTPIQEQTIPTLLQGGDVIGCAQTGTGKTAAFSLPVLQKINPGATAHPQALIITPTRELAEQIFKSIQDYTRFMPVRCVAVYGGVPSRGQEAALKKGVDIVVATPGRLLDLLQKPSLRLYDVRFLILDEADRMLDMGFIPDVENIVSYVPRTRQTLLFSATMPPEIEKLARKVTRTQSAEMIVVGERSSSADTVTQWICKVGDRDKMSLLIQLLKNAEMVSTIIFTRTKLGCAELSRRLDDAGISAMAIHSNLTQTQRQNALDRFKRGECRILVATDIAARGLDIEKVSHVINFDTPTHPEDYVHRVGRTGRALAKGEAFTFVAPPEIRHLKNIEKLIRRELPEFIPDQIAPASPPPQQTASRPERPAKARPARGKKASQITSKPEKVEPATPRTATRSHAEREKIDSPESKPQPSHARKVTQARRTPKAVEPALPAFVPSVPEPEKKRPEARSHSVRENAQAEPTPSEKTQRERHPQRTARGQETTRKPFVASPVAAVPASQSLPSEVRPNGRAKTGNYTPRQAAPAPAAPSKPSHSAKMSKSVQPGSPTSSRFYRHDDDVDWIEED